jgi:hypothetical protein
MSLWTGLTFTLLGVLVVLLPVTVIALSASKLAPQVRTALLVLCGGAVFLLAVVAADIAEVVPNRLMVDLTLLIGGLAIGMFAGVFLPFRPFVGRSSTPKIP